MTAITHHTPDALLAAYAVGNLPHPYALTVATHISLCIDCRAAWMAHQTAGGAVLESTSEVDLSDGLKLNTLDMLDEAFVPEPIRTRSGVYPAPVMEALKGKPPKWKSLGMGVRQCIISAGKEGSARLLYIPSGQAVPDHSHNGLELTLVLQGSFSDITGRFGIGDLEVADQSLEHTPTADVGEPCICLAATNAPLRFNALVPRILQPIFRI